ncbi:PAS domain S-box protein [Fulvivirgaceae bacterium PWU4]|uniref:histidine kinase n=1 Tax=Chryseosolibacter histidini TaxID=2782349 RepID=A0AAP2GP77_9BACT|nr:hybrid sensor histidine kinase/response regulator [Chryseosolibacter histidini]MBT1698798.1 PAS domain S-box protein [Chryseosolibacter histidini]
MYDPSKPVRILIIDDDEDDFILTSGFLKGIEDRTLDIQWCYNYKAALQQIASKAFDLYLVDYRLGAKTGIDLLKEAMSMNCEEPIILLTGKGNPNIDKQAMEMGAVDYLVKAELTTEKLERCIRYSLERAASTKALRSNERKYRNIFEKSKEAVFTTDQALVFRDVNTAMSRLAGCDKHQLLNSNLYQLIDNESTRAQIQERLAKAGEINDMELEFNNTKGKKRYCILNLSLERDSNNNVYVQGILHDITNQKKTERATLLAEKLAATGRLVRTLAHEVRNPLSNIHMSLEQLNGLTRDEDRIYLDIIDRNGKRINDLITELLTSSKPAEMSFEKIAMQTVIDDTIAIALDRITLKQIKLKLNYPETPCYIRGDKNKLKIAFLNIIINAIEAISHDHGELSIAVTSTEESNSVEISDNGCGIPTENLSKLFEPYFTSKRNGIGLGLASTLNIIQAHNATVEVRSKVDEGTTFVVIFNHG